VKIRASLLAAASSLAIVAGLAAPAGAATTVNVANSTVQCMSIVGTLGFVPPLVIGGTSADAITVKATISGCSTPAAVTIASGSISSTINSATNDCLGLSGLSTSTTGNLVAKWKTATGSSKITPTTSTLHVAQTNGAQFNSGTPAGDQDTWGGVYGLFQIGSDAGHGGTLAPSVTGAFTGGNGGATSNVDATTGQDVGAIATMCFGAGVKTLNFGIGQTTLQ
jgi:hypothetical protein